MVDRLLAEDGVVEKLTARNGPLEQLTTLTEGLAALTPTIDTLQDAVVTLSQVVNPLSNIADRIPLGRVRPRRVGSRTVASPRVIDADE